MFAFKTIPRMHNKREKLPGFQRNFAALFVLNYWLREFPLSAIANLFELKCQQKQLVLYPGYQTLSKRKFSFRESLVPRVLLLLSCKICPCSLPMAPSRKQFYLGPCSVLAQILKIHVKHNCGNQKHNSAVCHHPSRKIVMEPL